MATEQQVQFLQFPLKNQGFFNKVGNFLAGVVGSLPTTEGVGTQTFTNNSLPGGG
ncbi:MAG: hypothetical protein O4751_10435 [Trichodesmium sp. St2_bin6]|uniref:hypothetical protein n=1 Tax=Trichodesmium erythraeum TaxID=1206 RepID=UPI0003190BFD|nr:hypothetical protein [Trichodesmium sp. St2_bin6]MDE5102722.1 hypothetical protein [Trichodesmium sp. St19_bin2]MDT9340543.1 hypothetical protein [Trichodesmium erythraeum 21-75]